MLRLVELLLNNMGKHNCPHIDITEVSLSRLQAQPSITGIEVRMYGNFKMEVPTATASEKAELVNFLKCFINLMYFLGVCPFRLVWSKNSFPQVILIRRWLQSMLCVINTVATLICCMGQIRASNFVHSKKPPDYFRLLYQILLIPELLLWTKLLWLNSERIVHSINFILNSKNNFPTLNRKAAKNMKVLATTVFALTALIAVATVFTSSYQSFFRRSAVSRQTWWFKMIWEGKLNFFVQNTTAPIPISSYGKTDLMWGCLGIWMYLCR